MPILDHDIAQEETPSVGSLPRVNRGPAASDDWALMDEKRQIERFLDGSPFAVVGASNDRRKYGNKVLRAYMQTERKVYAVNPNAAEVESQKSYSTLVDVPEPLHGISIVTPPKVTLEVVEQAVALGIRHIWMQPGAENDAAIELARSAQANVIANGPCLLVALRFREDVD